MGDVHALAERKRWQILPGASAFERLAGGPFGSLRGVPSMKHRGRFGRKNDLRFIDLCARQSLQLGNLAERKVGEQPEEASDIQVLGIPPELPVIIGTQL